MSDRGKVSKGSYLTPSQRRGRRTSPSPARLLTSLGQTQQAQPEPNPDIDISDTYSETQEHPESLQTASKTEQPSGLTNPLTPHIMASTASGFAPESSTTATAGPAGSRTNDPNTTGYTPTIQEII